MFHQWKDEKVAALYVKTRPLLPQELGDRIVIYLKEKYKGELKLCADVGCGNGQGTTIFSRYFEQVLGIDISPAQLDAAKQLKHPGNVEFICSPAEDVPLKSGTAQIVAAATAAHLFDLPLFFKEADRVLCLNGVIALSCFSLDSFVFLHPTKAAELEQEFKNVYLDNLATLAEGDSRRLWIDGYASIKLPYPDFKREEVWTEETSMTLASLTAYYSSYASYHKYCKLNGDAAGQAILDKFISNCQKILQTTEVPETLAIKLKFRFFLLMGRKEINTP